MRTIAWFGMVTIVTLGGCTVTTTREPVYAEPVGYTETTAAPADYEAYPNTVYEGHTVFFVSGRWMFRDRDRWVSYRSEPPQLRQHREVNHWRGERGERHEERREAPREERHEERR